MPTDDQINNAIAKVEVALGELKALVNQTPAKTHPNVRNGRYYVEDRPFSEQEAEVEKAEIRRCFEDGLINSDKRRGAIMRVTNQTVGFSKAPVIRIAERYTSEEAERAKNNIDRAFEAGTISYDKRRGLKRSVTIRTAA